MTMDISVADIKKYDKQDMLGKLKKFPMQCEEGNSYLPPRLPDRIVKKVVFCGMGGSAIAGDIINAVACENSGVPCFVNRDYTLPLYVDRETLAVIVSYSGNTEETLSVLEQAQKKGSSLMCISSNGEIEKIAGTKNIPYLKIPGGFPPRCAMGYLFFPCYKIMSMFKIVPELNIRIFNLIHRWSDTLCPESRTNIAKDIASKFHDRVPLIYSSSRLFPAIIRWKTQIAENSKSFAFVNVFPEMNHNEIMSWRYPEWFTRKTIPVFIDSDKDHARIKLRFEITREIVSHVNPDIVDIKTEGESLLEEIFYLVLLGDWVSFYLAILNDSDPTEISGIDLLKKKMGGAK